MNKQSSNKPLIIVIIAFVVVVLAVLGGMQHNKGSYNAGDNTSQATELPNFSDISSDDIAGHTLQMKFRDTDAHYRRKTLYFNFYKDGHFVISKKPVAGDLDKIGLQAAYDKTNNTILDSIDLDYYLSDDEDDVLSNDEVWDSLEHHGISKDPDAQTANASRQYCNWDIGDDSIAMKFGYYDDGNDFIVSLVFKDFEEESDGNWKGILRCPEWTIDQSSYIYHVDLKWVK